jgi:hypothetical protein
VAEKLDSPAAEEGSEEHRQRLTKREDRSPVVSVRRTFQRDFARLLPDVEKRLA